MAISILGYYELPLEKEERAAIYPLVKADVERKITVSIREHLRDVNMQTFHILRSCFEITALDEMNQEIKNRHARIFDKLKAIYPHVAELQDETNTTVSAIFDDDGIPTLVLSPWLKDIVDGSGTVTVDSTQISDATIVGQWKMKVRDNPELRVITKENKSLIEFNDKFNELISDYYFKMDFTEVIKELVTAVKEGKYK